MKYNAVTLLLGTVVSFSFAIPLPSHFDWREELKGLSPVRSQGNCGNPVAFVMTGAMELGIKRFEGINVTLSNQQVTVCDIGYGCKGGFVNLKFGVEHGLSLESDYPYTPGETKCNKSVPIYRVASDWGEIKNDNGSKPTIPQLKKAILEYGAVATTMNLNNEFVSYTGGVFKKCGNSTPNHAVLLIGWDDATASWIARNSWGEKWGEKGYFRIAYGCNGIGEMAQYLIYK